MAEHIEDVDLTGKNAIINRDYNSWGTKLNAVDNELADKLNETIQVVNELNSIAGVVTKFTQLSDVPSSYVGKANKFVRVDQDESKLIFTDSTGSGSSWEVITTTHIINSGTAKLKLVPSSDNISIYLPQSDGESSYYYDIVNNSDMNYKVYIRDISSNLLYTLYQNCLISISMDSDESIWTIVDSCKGLIKTLPYTSYSDFNGLNYKNLPNGTYRVSGLGSYFTNCPITLSPTLQYIFIMEILNQESVYRNNVTLHSTEDTQLNNLKFNRYGDSFNVFINSEWHISNNNETFTGNITLPSTTSIGNISSTEISYLDNVTSNIQEQLNEKLELDGYVGTARDLKDALDLKADLVGGKVPLSQIQTSLDDYREAYYNISDDLFYDEPTFTTLTEQLINTMYLDLLTEDTYRWTGSLYKKTGTMQVATQTANGLMSYADKLKLDNITSDANKVEGSSTNGNILIDTVETTVYTHPNHSGDVVSVADGSTTIQANVVGNSKLSKVPSMTLKGNNTGLEADVDDLTVLEVQTMLEINKIAIKYSLVFG